MFIFLIIFLLISHLNCRPIDVPNLLVCDSVDCVRRFKMHLIQNDGIGAVIVSYNFDKDSVLAAHSGWLFYLLSYTDLNIMIMIIDLNCRIETSCEKENEEYFNDIIKMPLKTIFISFQHSNGFHPGKLVSDRLRSGYHNIGILFHLTHDQPFSTDTTNFQNMKFGDSSMIAIQYIHFPLVYRNYYYAPFILSSQYLPIGPCYYGMYTNINTVAINNTITIKQQQHIINQNLIKSSNRSILCSFRGKLRYSIISPFHKERKDILHLHSMGEFPCLLHDNSPSLLSRYDIEGYSKLMRNTVFAPCPSGNNPETSRIFEVTVAHQYSKIFFMKLILSYLLAL